MEEASELYQGEIVQFCVRWHCADGCDRVFCMVGPTDPEQRRRIAEFVDQQAEKYGEDADCVKFDRHVLARLNRLSAWPRFQK